MLDILNDVFDERDRQDNKWGEQNHPDEWWLPILVEEIGELSEAMLDAHFGMSPDKPTDVRKELVEAIAVGIAWLECMDRR
jgi:NTP pyrophosphatase (non-canonical NTP hydrolase)